MTIEKKSKFDLAKLIQALKLDNEDLLRPVRSVQEINTYPDLNNHYRFIFKSVLENKSLEWIAKKLELKRKNPIRISVFELSTYVNERTL